MTIRISNETTLPEHSLNANEDLRIIRQIEARAQALQMEIWKLQNRWDKRVATLHNRRGENVRITYNFNDILA
jgi:hypothetical protein